MRSHISMCAEVKRDGRWEAASDAFVYPGFDPDEPESESNSRTCGCAHVAQNSCLFEILAGVRYGQGCHGAVAAQDLAPIDVPRGIPDDASPEFMDALEWFEQNLTCYSLSWLSLEELLAYDWKGQSTIHYFDPIWEEDYERRPAGCRCVGRKSGDTRPIRVLTPNEYADMLSAGTRDVEKRYLICTPRPMTYYECAREFVDETIPALSKLGRPRDVRIVFFFYGL